MPAAIVPRYCPGLVRLCPHSPGRTIFEGLASFAQTHSDGFALRWRCTITIWKLTGQLANFSRNLV